MRSNWQSKILILLIFNINIISNAKEIYTTSPNNKLKMIVNIEDFNNEKSCLVYEVFYEGKQVIHKSRLGLDTAPKGIIQNTWQNNFLLVNKTFSSKDTTWNPIFGERKEIRENYNELLLTLKSNNIDKKRNKKLRGNLNVIIRVYNSGIAFKYYFSKGYNAGGFVRIASDKTEFTMPSNTKGYFTERSQGKYKYLPLSKWEGEIERPLTLSLNNGLFVSLAEAEMVDYCRTNFKIDKFSKNTICCEMYDTVDEMEPFSTPWRVIFVADSPGKLLENNDLILMLNPPCKIDETSWIKPGKVMRDFTLSTKGAKNVINFAEKQNIQFLLFDAGWYGNQYNILEDATTVSVDPKKNPIGDLNLQEVISYAKSKNIGIILYVNQRALATQLDSILPVYKSWGISGIKFGFVQVGSHYWTKWLHDAVKKCAEYNLMVDIHDGYRPTGFSRTYPNLITQEGIRGNEEMPDATHNTILPFTRFIAGAADYTFCYYYREDLGHPKRHIQNSAAHQLALPIVFYSPWQFIYWYDKPEDYQEEPELEFWKNMPTTWDDTKVIAGQIGEYISIARKSDSEWFIGSITNTESRELELSLSFLDPDEKYEATIYSDDSMVQTRTHVGISTLQVNSKSILSVSLKASGGQAIHIKLIE